ncbi:MAG TPA: PAS domain S-box protein [Xanthobacteraceae bacterium]|jgi:PAS domain S-box-containing protein
MHPEATSAQWLTISDAWRLFNLFPVAAFVCVVGGFIKLFSHREVELWACAPDPSTPAHLYCRPHQFLLPNSNRIANIESSMAQAFRTRTLLPAREVLLPSAEGYRLPCLSNNEPLRDHDGKCMAAISRVQRNFELLYLSNRMGDQRQLRDMLQRSPDRVSSIARDVTVPIVNAVSMQIWKACSLANGQGAIMIGQIVPEQSDEWQRNHKDAWHGEALSWEYDFIGPRGAQRCMETQAAPFHFPNGTTTAFAVPCNVRQKKKDEEALAQSQSRTQLILDAALNAFLSMDQNGRITEWNAQAEAMFGWRREEAIGRRLCEMLIPQRFRADHRRGLRHFLTSGEGRLLNRMFEITALRRDGSEFPIKLSVVPYCIGKHWVFSAFVQDITERKHSEESLRQYREVLAELAHTNRVAVLGQLSTSLAHEINQPIGAAIANAAAAVRWTRTEAVNLVEVRNALNRIIQNCIRAGHIIDRVRALVRKSPPRKDSFDINEAIQEVLALMRSQLAKSGISTRTQLAESLPTVEGDRIQLQQVLLNLYINAIDAMIEKVEGPRELVISSERISNEIFVAVQDTGVGFAPNVADQLFQPFHTTKRDGLGLGLSICRSIIEAHEGRLWATPNAPGGAIFQFTLPALGKVGK